MRRITCYTLSEAWSGVNRFWRPLLPRYNGIYDNQDYLVQAFVNKLTTITLLLKVSRTPVSVSSIRVLQAFFKVFIDYMACPRGDEQRYMNL